MIGGGWVRGEVGRVREGWGREEGMRVGGGGWVDGLGGLDVGGRGSGGVRY